VRQIRGEEQSIEPRIRQQLSHSCDLGLRARSAHRAVDRDPHREVLIPQIILDRDLDCTLRQVLAGRENGYPDQHAVGQPARQLLLQPLGQLQARQRHAESLGRSKRRQLRGECLR
jgi:hypothetical protein